MALGIDYARQDCSLARALEMVGERWTMLILRDCFFGVRRFSDLETHLDISKAVLTQRLAALVTDGLLVKVPRGGRDDYVLTDAALDLWPSLFALTQWGETRSDKNGPRRVFTHSHCGSAIERTGLCPRCGVVPGPETLTMAPGPGADPTVRSDAVSVALRTPHRLLEALF